MRCRRVSWTLVAVLGLLSATTWAAVAEPEQQTLSEQINVGQHFYMFGGADSSFWDALLGSLIVTVVSYISHAIFF